MRRVTWKVMARVWVGGLLLGGMAAFGGGSAAQATEGKAAGCDAASHQELVARVEKLEGLVQTLLHELATSRAGEVATSRSPEALAVAKASEGPAPMADARSRHTFYDEVVYLPSRGWSADWLGTASEPLELRTFIDLEYVDAGPDGTRAGVSHFDNHHVQVFLDSRLRPNLQAHAELEWEHSGDTVEVDQAYVSWAIRRPLNVDLGRFYTPFGIERFVWYSPTNALVSRPEAFRVIVPNNFYAAGVKLGGLLGGDGRPTLSYELAVTDGLSRAALADRRGSRQTRDDNSNRALSGRLGLAFDPRFEVGASWHGQRISADGAFDQDLTFVGLDLAGRWLGFELRGEWVEAQIDRPRVGGLVPDPLEQAGFYGQLTYTFDWDRVLLPSFTLATRFEEVDLDRAALGNDDRRLVSLGVNAAILRQFRLKAEFQSIEEDGLDLDDDRVLFQAVVDF